MDFLMPYLNFPEKKKTKQTRVRKQKQKTRKFSKSYIGPKPTWRRRNLREVPKLDNNKKKKNQKKPLNVLFELRNSIKSVKVTIT